jgi:hypothetical protein
MASRGKVRKAVRSCTPVPLVGIELTQRNTRLFNAEDAGEREMFRLGLFSGIRAKLKRENLRLAHVTGSEGQALALVSLLAETVFPPAARSAAQRTLAETISSSLDSTEQARAALRAIGVLNG